MDSVVKHLLFLGLFLSPITASGSDVIWFKDPNRDGVLVSTTGEERFRWGSRLQPERPVRTARASEPKELLDTIGRWYKFLKVKNNDFRITEKPAQVSEIFDVNNSAQQEWNQRPETASEPFETKASPEEWDQVPETPATESEAFDKSGSFGLEWTRRPQRPQRPAAGREMFNANGSPVMEWTRRPQQPAPVSEPLDENYPPEQEWNQRPQRPSTGRKKFDINGPSGLEWTRRPQRPSPGRDTFDINGSPELEWSRRPQRPEAPSEPFNGNGSPDLDWPLMPHRPQRPQRPGRMPSPDRLIFPNEDNNSGNQETTTISTQTQTQTKRTETTTTNCERNCLATPEFNPVCGSNAVTYSNPSRMKCAQTCGREVEFEHYGSCGGTRLPRRVWDSNALPIWN